MQLITLDGLKRFKDKVDELFVSKEYKTGSTTEYKQLSDNNLTDELVEKINNAGSATAVTENIATAKGEAITESNSYTDTEVAEAKTEAVTESKSYTDTEVADAKTEAVSEAKAYTDTTAATAKTEAVTASNSYTDTEVNEALNEAKSYADTAEADAVASAKTYTDTTAATAKTEAVSESKTYADEQVAAAKTELQADINSKISSAYKVKGSKAFADLPALSESEEGNVYNLTEEFTTTADFVEGEGKKYPAGTNIVCIEESEGEFKWDVLPGFIDTDSFVLSSSIEEVTESEIDALFA